MRASRLGLARAVGSWALVSLTFVPVVVASSCAEREAARVGSVTPSGGGAPGSGGTSLGVAGTATGGGDASGGAPQGGAAGGHSEGGEGGEGGSTNPPSSCAARAVTAPPVEVVTELNLDPFYKKHLGAAGLAIVSSEKVEDGALRVACEIVEFMLSKRPDVAGALRSNKIRVGIMDVDEVTTDMPEHSDLYEAFPGTDWDTRARGLGATKARPLTSVGEENLLRFPSDPYLGESILVHEFAHAMWLMGVAELPDGAALSARLTKTYADALAAGLWKDTYAATNADEYFAEGVQGWFDTNLEASPPNGIHNAVNTRAELIAYDPDLAALIEEVMPSAVWSVP